MFIAFNVVNFEATAHSSYTGFLSGSALTTTLH